MTDAWFILWPIAGWIIGLVEVFGHTPSLSEDPIWPLMVFLCGGIVGPLAVVWLVTD